MLIRYANGVKVRIKAKSQLTNNNREIALIYGLIWKKHIGIID
jgi:hypothetical protein